MFEPDSRYYKIENATLTVTDSGGSVRSLTYKRRRFIPSGQNQATLLEHRYQQGERLDNITARYLGDPTRFWQICDANQVLQPTELTEEIGRAIKVALPQL